MVEGTPGMTDWEWRLWEQLFFVRFWGETAEYLTRKGAAAQDPQPGRAVETK